MATHVDRDDDRTEGVEFIHEDDGSITARDLESGIASFGDSKAEALAMLADALSLENGDPIDAESEVLSELGIDHEAVDEERATHDELPDFMQ